MQETRGALAVSQRTRSHLPVTVVFFSQRADEEEAALLEGLLDARERQRAAAIRAPLRRHRFIVAHARIRQILARILGVDARSVPITADTRGKPELPLDRPVAFNLSHTGDLAAVVLAPGTAPVGIDLELRRPFTDPARIDRLARRCLDTTEFREFAQLRPKEKADVLLRVWTRKEAFVKALGTGLDTPLRAVHVGVGPTPHLAAVPAEAQAWYWHLTD
ncbi:MAG: 4'-phosphopantetheinyl transferase superfamily protein, partial [Acidothermus sp.]|nr:4'-phosphopantetheinyl transferase superfamily protein [Acidothermus sp.]